MDSTVSRAMWMLILAALFCATDALFLCGSGEQREDWISSTTLQSDGYRFDQYSNNLDKCSCTIRANGTVYLKSTVEFMREPGVQGTNDTCGPILRFQEGKMKYSVCPKKQENDNITVVSHHLNHEDTISIEILNSGQTGIMVMISLDADIYQGTFSLECQKKQTITPRGLCPCNPMIGIGMGDTGFRASEDVSLGTRFAIAIVCVIIFLVIFGGLFLLWWKKLRHRDSDDYKDGPDGMPQQPVPVAPAGLTHLEKGHINPQFTDIGKDGQRVEDPELNLALQTPSNSMGSKGLRGSTDSGLYSQGNGQYYANVPGDHADGLPPDMLYTPGLNLSGHADLQGPAPRSNRPVDVDALYAKPSKGHHHRPKSGSQDQLNAPVYPGQQPQGHGHQPHGPVQHPEWAVNESYVSDSSHNASQGSLNTSQPVVETDV